MVDNATHALASSATAKPTFNVEEEDVVIRNGCTPKEEGVIINVSMSLNLMFPLVMSSIMYIVSMIVVTC